MGLEDRALKGEAHPVGIEDPKTWLSNSVSSGNSHTLCKEHIAIPVCVSVCECV